MGRLDISSLSNHMTTGPSVTSNESAILKSRQSRRAKQVKDIVYNFIKKDKHNDSETGPQVRQTLKAKTSGYAGMR